MADDATSGGAADHQGDPSSHPRVCPGSRRAVGIGLAHAASARVCRHQRAGARGVRRPRQGGGRGGWRRRDNPDRAPRQLTEHARGVHRRGRAARRGGDARDAAYRIPIAGRGPRGRHARRGPQWQGALRARLRAGVRRPRGRRVRPAARPARHRLTGDPAARDRCRHRRPRASGAPQARRGRRGGRPWGVPDPLGLTRPPLRPADFRGAYIGVRRSALAKRAFESLDATVGWEVGDRPLGFDGIETDLGGLESGRLDVGAASLTADVSCGRASAS